MTYSWQSNRSQTTNGCNFLLILNQTSQIWKSDGQTVLDCQCLLFSAFTQQLFVLIPSSWGLLKLLAAQNALINIFWTQWNYVENCFIHGMADIYGIIMLNNSIFPPKKFFETPNNPISYQITSMSCDGELVSVSCRPLISSLWILSRLIAQCPEKCFNAKIAINLLLLWIWKVSFYSLIRK